MSETHVNACHTHTLTYLPNCPQCHISGLSGVWQRLCVGYWVSATTAATAARLALNNSFKINLQQILEGVTTALLFALCPTVLSNNVHRTD